MSDNTVSIILRNDDPAAFERLIGGIEFIRDPEAAAWGKTFLSKYHALTRSGPFYAFAVVIGGAPVALVECDPDSQSITYYGDPTPIHLAANVAENLAAQATEVALDCLGQMARQVRRQWVLVADRLLGSATEIPQDFPVSHISRICQAQSATRFVATEGRVDLSFGESGIHRNLRKSYRSLVNWGRRSMRTHYYHAGNPDRALMQEYAALRVESDKHGALDERVFQFLCDFIESGRGELSLGEIDGKIVGATLTGWAGKTTHYIAGVYPGAANKLPLAHWPLYDAILRSLGRGSRTFSMGRMFVHDTHALSPEKIRRNHENIAFFKKGFCTELVNRAYWAIRTGK